MDYKIRELKQNEISVLNTFLYEAIFIPDGVEALPYEIINQPELQVYVTDFGKKKGDICYVSECDNKIVGAVWVRIMNDYGHVDDETPSFAISLLKEYRNYGIGTEFQIWKKQVHCCCFSIGLSGCCIFTDKVLASRLFLRYCQPVCFY